MKACTLLWTLFRLTPCTCVTWFNSISTKTRIHFGVYQPSTSTVIVQQYGYEDHDAVPYGCFRCTVTRTPIRTMISSPLNHAVSGAFWRRTYGLWHVFFIPVVVLSGRQLGVPTISVRVFFPLLLKSRRGLWCINNRLITPHFSFCRWLYRYSYYNVAIYLAHKCDMKHHPR